MQIRKFRALLFCCALLLATGCNYKTLKFFFDGVPVPQKKKQRVAQGQTLPEPVRVTVSRHAPYEEKQCDACHDRARTNTLIAPKEELCFTCHDFPMDKKYVHGPLASGGCLVCHDPHTSKYPTLLVAEARTFCFYCHDAGAIPQDESHARTDVQCVACHEAHMSDKKFLLK